jgi:hypothetical protein
MWPSPDRERALPTPGELLAWGLFSSLLAAVLTLVLGAGAGRTLYLGGLGLAATVALWAAARFGPDAPWEQTPGEPPTGA